jgi:Arc/MetJ-type ribon-helix-helix transcriptional regulator
MRKNVKGGKSVSTILPESVKKEILNLIENNEFDSVSEFLREATYRFLDEKAAEKEDILKEKNFRRFIEKIS